MRTPPAISVRKGFVDFLDEKEYDGVRASDIDSYGDWRDFEHALRESRVHGYQSSTAVK